MANYRTLKKLTWHQTLTGHRASSELPSLLLSAASAILLSSEDKDRSLLLPGFVPKAADARTYPLNPCLDGSEQSPTLSRTH